MSVFNNISNSVPDSRFYSEGVDVPLQYNHVDGDGLTPGMGFLPSPMVTSSSPHRDRQNRPVHSPITPSPPMTYNKKATMSDTWSHEEYPQHQSVSILTLILQVK